MPSSPAEVSQLGKLAGYIEILAKDPRSTVFVPLAETYRQLGLLDDALEVASKGVQILPRFSPGYTVLGRVQAQRGDLAAAAAAFEKALLLDPGNLTSLKGLARLHAQRGERQQAERLLQRAIAQKPDDAAALKMLAALAPAVAESPEVDASAAEGVDAGIDPASGDPISTATIAEIYIRQGFFNRALKVYRDLLQVDPHNDEIRRKLVELKQRIDSLQGSVETSVPVAEVPLPEAPSPPDATVLPEAPAPTMPPVESAGASSRQLETFFRWLESISSRRNAHVR